MKKSIKKKPTKRKPTKIYRPGVQLRRMPWEVFQESKLLWWVNRSLHLFGWAIVVVYDDEAKKVIDVYPARVRWRGFTEEAEAEGFRVLTADLAKNAHVLAREAAE